MVRYIGDMVEIDKITKQEKTMIEAHVHVNIDISNEMWNEIYLDE